RRLARRNPDQRLRRRPRRAAPRRLADPRLRRGLRRSEEVPEEHPLPRPRLRHPRRSGDPQADRRPEVAKLVRGRVRLGPMEPWLSPLYDADGMRAVDRWAIEEIG